MPGPLTPALLAQIEERLCRHITPVDARPRLIEKLKEARGDIRTLLEHVRRLGERELRCEASKDGRGQ